ncbi:MAG: type II secretion system F family protein [Planctomycetota bacterium]|jgi:type II secretory pathway component PulF
MIIFPSSPLVPIACGLGVLAVFARQLRHRRRMERRARLLEILAMGTRRALPLAPLLENAASDDRSLARMAGKVAGGAPLSESLPRGFPKHALAAIRAAEGTARLSDVLEGLARDEAAALNLRQQRNLAALYPLLLALALVGVTWFHAGLWHRWMDWKDVVISPLQKWGLAATLTAVGAVLLLLVWNRFGGRRLPAAERLLRCASSLLRAGMPMHAALRAAADASGLRAIAREARAAALLLEQGGGLEAAWSRISLPAFVRERAVAGTDLERLADECARRHRVKVERWLRWSQPLSLALLAVAVWIQYAGLMDHLNRTREAVWGLW